MAIVLTKEDKHGLIEDMDIAIVTFLGRFTLIVDDGIREIPILPAAF